MSDAMNPSPSLPDDSAQSSASPDPLEVEVNQPETGGNDWQTVNFPGALNVDAIPIEVANPNVRRLESANLFDQDGNLANRNNTPVMQQLQQENDALRTQIAQLEEDLSQAQIELQLEMARFYCKEADAAVVSQPQETEALSQAQAQIQELTEALTTTQQTLEQQQSTLEQQQSTVEQQQSTIAQQQTTIDTLIGQLDSSQQRIAQLERDCALSQQRYNEQLQLVSQAENTCQDLRVRLHRQQQQTLQFKAALEKSIEMNAVVDSSQAEPTAIAVDPLPHHPAEPSTAAFIPKARPVQPWSTAPRMTPHLHPHAKPGTGLPGLLAKLAKQPVPLDSPSEMKPPVDVEAIAPVEMPVVPEIAPQTPPMDEASKNILEFLFPAQQPSPIANTTPAQAAVFDLSPFIEAGEVDSDSIAAHREEPRPGETIVHQPKPEPPAPPSGPRSQAAELWADLARLIEPDLTDVETAVAPEASESAPIETHAVTLDTHTEPETTSRSEGVSSSTPPLSLVSFVISDSTAPEPAAAEPPIVAQNPFPSLTLYSHEVGENREVETAREMATISSMSEPTAATNSPSPILYPMRQPKKIPSMAAVDLPSFPRG